MSESKKQDGKSARQGSEAASVDALASRALSVVAQRSQKQTQQIDAELASRLHDAATRIDRNDVPAVIKGMLGAGVPAETIAVRYIPHVAREMGDEWCEDTLSFSHVTIGTARLQAALRTLGKEWWHDARANDAGENAGVVVIVVQDAFHTLGVNVLAGQLRRLGLSVRLAMGPSPHDLHAIFRNSQFDAVLLSASGSENLDFLREYVDTIRQSAPGRPPVIIGGGILDRDVDVKAATGADFATKDIYEALEHCGLGKTKRSTVRATGRRS